MELRTDEQRVVDLADEFGITISETLALCKMFDIPAPYGSSVITPAGATLLRGLARGEIKPESVDSDTLAEARGPSYQAANSAGSTSMSSDAASISGTVTADERSISEVSEVSEVSESSDGFDHLRGNDSGTDDGTSPAGSDSDSDYDYGDPADYDSYGVAGLDDFPSKGTVAQRTSAKENPVAAPAIPVPASPGITRGESTSSLAGGTPKIDRGAERRAAAERRQERANSEKNRRGNSNTRGGREAKEDRREYDPTKLRAEYDDIDKYVPKWLKYIALVTIAVFGFLAYQLFFGGTPDVANDGPQQTPLYSPGECFNADIALWIDTMVPTACAGEHDGEVFDVYTFISPVGSEYPDPSTLTSQARQACRGTFAAYTGESSIASDYRIGVSLPSSIDWAKGNRLGYCGIVSGDGTQITGSVAKG